MVVAVDRCPPNSWPTCGQADGLRAGNLVSVQANGVILEKAQ
jgi:hypothetical protein